MHEIKSFKILNTAIVVGLLHTIFFAVVAAIEILLMFSFSPYPTKPPLSSMLIGPPFMGVVFFSITALFCWMYNQIAARIGGIAFELTPRSEN